MLKAFTKEDLQHVSRVAMEPAPAGSGSISYKWAMAELLLAKGVQLSAEDLIGILRTGDFESPFEAQEANELRIKAENEELQQGRIPPVLVARTHWIDIPEHLSLLSSPDVVEKPEVVTAVLNTVAQKLALWRTMPPDLLALLGGPPPPMPVPMMPEAPGQPQSEGAAPQQQPQALEGAKA
jgi:hypothetical protein